MATISDVRAALALDLRIAAGGRVLPGGWAEGLRFGAAALLLPQVPALLWWMEAGSSVYLRGWINLEYLALLGVALLWPCWGTVALLVGEMCVALAEPLARIYYFSPGDMLRSVRFVLQIPGQRLMGYACLVLVYAVGSGVVLRACLGDLRRRGVKLKLAVIAALAMVALTSDLAMGRFKPRFHVGPERSDPGKRAAKISGTPVASTLFNMFFPPGHGRVVARQALGAALGAAIAEVPAGTQPNVVLVLTESWGLATDDRVNEAQMAPFRTEAMARSYRVESGSVPFVGPTTSGETRELCGDSRGDSSIAAAASYFASCWPERLRREGYRTIAVHGFTPTMFRRQEWYGRFGFEEAAFLPELARGGAAMCDGAFPGICDADVAQWIGGRLMHPADGRPVFVHWVTLNSHLPVPRMDESLPREGCAAAGIDEGQSLCTWFGLVMRVQESVARLAETPGLRPTIFVVVGDHAPPFVREDVRDRFSQTRVPYVVLMPRAMMGAAGRAEVAAVRTMESRPP
ncbi:MAG: sulfatase-like hydrolase/transferase [Acidobacteriaceae bacterium]|jgi:hypothetical protein